MQVVHTQQFHDRCHQAWNQHWQQWTEDFFALDNVGEPSQKILSDRWRTWLLELLEGSWSIQKLQDTGNHRKLAKQWYKRESYRHTGMRMTPEWSEMSKHQKNKVRKIIADVLRASFPQQEPQETYGPSPLIKTLPQLLHRTR